MTGQQQTRAASTGFLLLAWYDRHRRDLPWRSKPGEAKDPYRIWLSEIMLQQTTVATVGQYYSKFMDRFPTVQDLARAPAEAVMQAWAGLGYYARAKNLHACAKVLVEGHGGQFPRTEAALRELPGIGVYTAAAVAAIAFDEPAAAVDGNVERVIARLFRVDEPVPGARAQIRRLAVGLVPSHRPGDFAQALMELGAMLCTPRRPACALCPVAGVCAARAAGLAEAYPIRARRAKGELRRGAAFVALRADGCVLLRTRAPNGLLGGMTEVPSAWAADYRPGRAGRDAPLAARWRRLPGVVSHVFTHFPLELTVFRAVVPRETAAPPGMRFTPRERLSEEALPTLMKKVLAHALGG